MTRTRWIWVVLLALWALFFGWYTSFGGPLTEGEIAHYMALVEGQEPPPAAEDVERLRRFMEGDTGDDFAMVNVIDMYETPLAIEGVAPGDSSEEVLGKYMAYMNGALLGRACHPVLYGRAAASAMDLMNAQGMESWTTGAAMRYRSRRDMLEIALNPEFDAAHQFKVAAMRKTIAFPIDPWFHSGDPRLLLALLLGTVGCALSWREASRGGAT